MKSFESQWASAFDNAEIAPSEDLWTRIDSTLANDEATRYRRGIVFYRLLAAASIVIALGLGTLLFLQEDGLPLDEEIGSETTQPALPETQQTPPAQTTPLMADEEESGEDTKQEPATPEQGSEIGREKALEGLVAENTPGFRSDDVPQSNEIASPETRASITPMTIASKRHLLTGEFHLDPTLHLYNLPQVVVRKPRFKRDQLWAGLGLSSGSFDPNTGSANEADLAAEADNFAQRSAQEVANSSNGQFDRGISYSIAANAGWQFARRWILQSGLQYRISKSDLRTNSLIQNNLTDESFAGTNLGPQNSFEGDQFEVVSADVNLNNNFQFISIPVRVGYLVLDRKVQIGINTGLATDFFLKNKVTESNDLVEDFQQSRSSSPYRTTLFSGLFGVELGYNISGKYYLTAEPSYRRSFNSFTKDQTGLMTNPSGLGVTVGFRYLFK